MCIMSMLPRIVKLNLEENDSLICLFYTKRYLCEMYVINITHTKTYFPFISHSKNLFFPLNLYFDRSINSYYKKSYRGVLRARRNGEINAKL